MVDYACICRKYATRGWGKSQVSGWDRGEDSCAQHYLGLCENSCKAQPAHFEAVPSQHLGQLLFVCALWLSGHYHRTKLFQLWTLFTPVCVESLRRGLKDGAWGLTCANKLSQCEQCDEVACLLFASTSPTKPANKLEFLCCKLRAISDAAGNASFELNWKWHHTRLWLICTGYSGQQHLRSWFYWRHRTVSYPFSFVIFYKMSAQEPIDDPTWKKF